MQERVRICDIAEELGLSTATVSNVIHGKTQKVSDATVQRVTALLEEREYIPNMAGILLAQNDSRIIGVFVNDHEKYEGRTLSDFFIAESLNELSTQIEKTGRSAEYRPLVAKEDYLARQGRKFYDTLCGGSLPAFAAALCASGLTAEELEELRELLREGTL